MSKHQLDRPVPAVWHYVFRALDYATHVGANSILNRLVAPGDLLGPRLLRNYPYVQDGSRTHLLDVWMPKPTPGPTPVIFYVHGGGFTFGSKDTHQVVGRMFAKRGFLTFVINYGLAPRNPYPASIADCCKALCWVWDNLEHFGGDRDRLVIAGESAGGNLTALLAAINSYKRPEPFCKEVWDRNIPLKAAIPFCGWHDPQSLGHYREHPTLRRVAPILEVFTLSYLGKRWRKMREETPLASPLPLLDREPDRPLPPFFIPVGTRDPLLGDSRRLKKALDKRGVPAVLREYKGAVHAHHLLPFTKDMRQIWRDVHKFLLQPGIAGEKVHAVA